MDNIAVRDKKYFFQYRQVVCKDVEEGRGVQTVNYSAIKPCDIANGEGVRVSLFVSGCTHHCKGCFNERS